jgi:hypothetical protein
MYWGVECYNFHGNTFVLFNITKHFCYCLSIQVKEGGYTHPPDAALGHASLFTCGGKMGLNNVKRINNNISKLSRPSFLRSRREGDERSDVG